MSLQTPIVLVVEDELSEAVMRKVIASRASALEVADRVVRSGGFGNIKSQMHKFKTACHAFPHVVLTDLDRNPCPSALLSAWRVGPLPAKLVFRVAVHSVESWLLADREGISSFLSVPISKITRSPETLDDSKRELLKLARKARSRRLASELCPAVGSVARQGPLYNAHMVRFVRDRWRVDAACDLAPSLARACLRIAELASRAG